MSKNLFLIFKCIQEYINSYYITIDFINFLTLLKSKLILKIKLIKQIKLKITFKIYLKFYIFELIFAINIEMIMVKLKLGQEKD